MPNQYTSRTYDIGRRFGRLVVISEDLQNTRRLRRLICQCDCGSVVSVQRSNLPNGHTRSCGCLNLDTIAARSRAKVVHPPEFYAWRMMLARCENPRNNSYPHYGGRGITVCDRWQIFENFLTDMGSRPSSRHSIDRIDNDGPYSPENCRWATSVEQVRNRRTTLLVTHSGSTMPLAEWALAVGIPYRTLHARIQKGWSVEKVLTTPLRAR